MNAVFESAVEFNKFGVEQATKSAEFFGGYAERFAQWGYAQGKVAAAELAKDAQALSSVKDVEGFNALREQLLAAKTEKAAAVGRQAWDEAVASYAATAKFAEKSAADLNAAWNRFFTQATKNAPAGSEFALQAVKNAVAASQAVGETFAKAAKQGVEFIDSNVKKSQSVAQEAVQSVAKAASSAKARK